MRLESFRVVNYKSFADSEKMRFAPGFNVIVGRNNVGKTALVEAVSLRFSNKPHRSLRTVPTPNAHANPISEAEVSIRFDADELAELLVREMPVFYVPTDPYSQEPGETAVRKALSDGLTVEAGFQNQSLSSAKLSTYTGIAISGVYLRVNVDPKGEPRYAGPISGLQSDYPELGAALASKFLQRLYSFSAVRFGGTDESAIGANRALASDASNLVQVLDLLSRNTSRWRRYFERVRTVLPEIEAITFVPSEQGGGHVRAKLWNVDPDTEREDLAVPLSESGTGVGQVLAILYVVFTSEYPRTIVIDEPQSFLHPGAVRKLFEILKSYPQHQYVITTHSPNAVTAADPQALFLVRKKGEESVADQLNVSETRDQARFLREVGASLSDVFGADNVLWVEGPTEEECFPLILSKVSGRSLRGTKIVGVLSTGDLEGKRSRDVYRIYRRLTEAGGLLPPSVGFVFDREQRDERQREDLDRESGGLVSFLPRRMYENYLLNPKAIAWLLSELLGSSGSRDVSIDDVEAWIDVHGNDYSVGGAINSMVPKEVWLREVHGADLLKALFDHFSEGTVEYRKTEHGPQLTRWLCENEPENLKELAHFIAEQIDRNQRPQE